MAPKNKKKNGFYYYMKELQEREAAKGRRIPMSSMPTYAHPLWKFDMEDKCLSLFTDLGVIPGRHSEAPHCLHIELSVVEKEPYEEMARKYNKDPSQRGGRLASDGTRIEDNLRELEEEKYMKNKLLQDIKHFCNIDCPAEEFIELTSKKLLYFMSFNILCRTEDDTYIPIEVGLIEYSIKYGIHREYTKILYPGRPPFGYTNEAKNLSEDKHQIDIFGAENSEKNMKAVYEDILNFTNPTGIDEYPPVFCDVSQVEVTKGCLNWLANLSGQENYFEVWNAVYLLMELRAGVGEPFPSETNASDLLSNTSFTHDPNSRCTFHEERDSSYCALGYSKCLCYLISDAVCDLFNVTLTDKHIPSRTSEEKCYTVTVFSEPSRSTKPAISLNRVESYYDNRYSAEDNSASQNTRVPDMPSNPRQPATMCMAEQMRGLQLNATAATVPGAGVGRGIRRRE